MEQRKPKKKIIAIISTVIATVILISYFSTVYAAGAKDEAEDTLLREYPVARGDITAGTDGSGSLMLEGGPQSFSSPVKLEEVCVKTGDIVKKGDILARASREDLEQKLHDLGVELKKAEIALEDAQISKKEGSLSAGSDGGAGQLKAEMDAKKNEAQAEASGIAARIAQIEARIAEIDGHIAQIDAQLAEGSEGDSQDGKAALESEKTGLLEEREALQGQLAEARAGLEAAGQSVAQIESDKNAQLNEIYKQNSIDKQANALKQSSLDNAIQLAQIDVDEARTKIEQVQAALQSLELKADRDGIVLEVNYSAGMETTDENALASIGDPAEMFARLQVSQADIADIEEGQEVQMQFDAFPEMTFTGKVLKKLTTPVKDSNPVAYLVDVSVDMQDMPLLAGMTCSAQFIIKQVKDVVMLSNKAIKVVDGKQVVLLKDEEGTLYEQAIETGFSDGKFSEILSGVAEEQTVYVEG